MEKDLIKSRREKLDKLISQGINPYPSVTNRTHSSADAKEASGKVTVAGRMRLIRGHGKALFADLYDETGKIQLYFKFDELGEKKFNELELLDIGDFIEATGEIFVTKTGEKTVRVSGFNILVKTLMSLPDKWHGLKDVEDRYRMRYLDLMFNPEVKKLFEIRSKTVQGLRNYLLKNNFTEVETPVLQSIAGGASARPFITHYNAYDSDVYLRIAPELFLKRLLVGGYERVFEFARCFRNEGVDWNHNPEFTNLEFYVAYFDYEKLMKFTEEMISAVVKEATGQNYIEKDGKKIEIKPPFKRVTFDELTGGKRTDEAFKEGVKKITEPTFVINHPADLLPLAKEKSGTDVAESFQLVIGGVELVKAFSEQNNPVNQAEAFVEQQKLRAKGDEEAQMGDAEFITALEYGMPPTAGWGLGVDRFVMLLAGAKTLREIIFFPFMKSKQSEAKIVKNEETQEAVIILNKDSNLSGWQEDNTIAHLSASFAGRKTTLFTQDKIKTKDNKELSLNIRHAILTKEASTEEINNIIQNSDNFELFEFTREMLETTSDNKIIDSTLKKNFFELDVLGILIFGNKKQIDVLTKDLKLKE